MKRPIKQSGQALPRRPRKAKPATKPARPTKRLAAVIKLFPRPRLAELCGISLQAVHQWRDVPPRFALTLEKASEGKLTREFLAPRFYPSPAAR
jgi:hypothetical protein